MKRPFLRTVWFIVLLTSLLGNWCSAQDAWSTADVLAMVPPDAIGLVTVRPRLIAQDDAFKMMPLEIMSAASVEEIGFDPLKIERIDMIVGVPGITGLQFAMLVSFTEEITPDSFKRLIERGLLPHDELLVLIKGPRRAILGPSPYVKRLINAEPMDGELRRLAGRMSEPGHFSLVVALEPMRDMLIGFAESPALQRVPQVGTDLATIAAKTKMVALRVQLGAKPLTAVALEAANEADTVALDESLTRLIDLSAKAGIATVEREAAQDPGRMSQAIVAYTKRLAEETRRQLKFQRTGNRLLVKLDGQQMALGQAGVLSGILLPAVQAARDAARRMQSSNNLKQIVLAMLNYEAQYKVVPGDFDVGKNQKGNATVNPAKLSWRVKILPFLGEQELYDEFHHDEPWDSPHNRKLLERMPAVFKHPQSSAPAGQTVYQMPTGDHLAAQSGRRLRIVDFTDGSANTIAVLETRDEAAVPWTKPGDCNPLEPREVLRNQRGSFQVAMLDGSVHTLPSNLQPETLRKLLTRDAND